MALSTVNAGDAIIPDDVNQFQVFLNLVNGDATLIKEFTGTIASAGVATIPHGLGRVPFSLIGYYSITSLAATETDGLTIVPRHDLGGNVSFASTGNVSTAKAADNTNIYIRNGSASTIYYKVYII